MDGDLNHVVVAVYGNWDYLVLPIAKFCEEKKNAREDDRRRKITYQYEVAGATYENERFRIGIGFSEQAEETKQKLKAGDPIDVLYDPEAPRRATVVRYIEDTDIELLLLVSCFPLVGIMLLIYAHFRGEKVPPGFHSAPNKLSGVGLT